MKDFFKKELKGWNRLEKIVFPLSILAVIIISIKLNDSKLALISSICGITYTILAGKGRIYCYFIGLFGTFCYSYLSFVNSFFGNFVLNLFYYVPMQIVGIFRWRKHLKNKTNEIYKTKLTAKERYIYFPLFILLSLIISLFLKRTGDITPYMDGFATGLSVFGQFLTVKRCIEQWFIWFIVNLLSLIMWYQAYLLGSKSAVYIFMWGLYLLLSVYFYFEWRKEINSSLKKD